MSYTQIHIDAIDAIIQAKITSGSIGAGRFAVGGISIDQGTSLDELFKIRSQIQALIDGAAGDVVIEMSLKGVD